LLINVFPKQSTNILKVEHLIPELGDKAGVLDKMGSDLKINP
jgi:hypothetical protein